MSSLSMFDNCWPIAVGQSESSDHCNRLSPNWSSGYRALEFGPFIKKNLAKFL